MDCWGVEFVLLDEDSEGNVVEREYIGAWVISDNGYRRWSITMPPMKVTLNQPEIRWSEWVESMRKDVECTFGILKGRWRVLKAGVRLHGTEAVDKIWSTCCALHNWLLEVDGLDEQWENGHTQSDWLSEMGDHNPSDQATSFALQRLASPSQFRSYDSSSMGIGNDRHVLNNNDTEEDEPLNSILDDDDDHSGVREVRKLPQEYFRRKLIKHFDIKWKRNSIIWPGCCTHSQS